ncbi:MAG: hypothetical protein KAH18_05775 [Psychromonas sp.]|nr:hypothetical protein [Psychromonas sp.]
MDNLKKALTILLIFSTNLFAHTIYAPNDIPLLDNRFRLDPKTQGVTIILNHFKEPQIIVLIRPDGSKIFQERHPENVAWVRMNKLDMITITNPMVGPWQVIANLDKNNRIKLISTVKLNVQPLPKKIYSKELLTTTATLTENNTKLKDPHYIDGALLRIAIIGKFRKKVFLYKDTGKIYDKLPFDGVLTAHVYADLSPGSHLLSISTQNNVFVRAFNKDIEVLPTPIKLKTIVPDNTSEFIKFNVSIDEKQIVPTSVTVYGTITDKLNSGVEQIIIHGTGSNQTVSKRLTYGDFLFKGKAVATTISGREIEIKLPDEPFTLIAPKITRVIKNKIGIALKNDSAQNKEDTGVENTEDEVSKPTLSISFWVAFSIAFVLACALILVVVLLIKEKMKNKSSQNIDDISDGPLEKKSKDTKKS